MKDRETKSLYGKKIKKLKISEVPLNNFEEIYENLKYMHTYLMCWNTELI